MKDGNYIAEVWGFGVYNLDELHLDSSNKSKVSSLIYLMFYLKHFPFVCVWSHFIYTIRIFEKSR